MVGENQVTTKDPKKAEAGKRLAEYNPRKREVQKSQVSEYYRVGGCFSCGDDRQSWLLPLPSQDQCCAS